MPGNELASFRSVFLNASGSLVIRSAALQACCLIDSDAALWFSFRYNHKCSFSSFEKINAIPPSMIEMPVAPFFANSVPHLRNFSPTPLSIVEEASVSPASGQKSSVNWLKNSTLTCTFKLRFHCRWHRVV